MDRETAIYMILRLEFSKEEAWFLIEEHSDLSYDDFEYFWKKRKGNKIIAVN